MKGFLFGVIAVIALGVIGVGALTATQTHAEAGSPVPLLDVTSGVNCLGEPAIPN